MTLNRIAFMLLWLFVFTIPMTQATEFPMLGTLSHAAGLAAVAVGMIAVVARKRVRVLGPVHIAMAAFILWSAVTLSWSVAPDLTVQRVLNYLQLFVVLLLLWEMCVEEKDILWMLNAFVVGTILPALSTLYGFLPGQQILIERASNHGYDANQLAFLLALSLPASYFLILRDSGSLVSLYRFQMGFAVCAILLTGSASSMIAAALGLSIVFWTAHTLSVRSRTVGFSVVMLLAGVTWIAIPSNVWKGVTEQAYKGDITLTTVVNREVRSFHSTPLGGLGAGTQTQPTSFTMFAETGVVGVVCFLGVFSMLFMAACRMSIVNRSFWFTSLAVSIVGSFSLNWDCSQPAWLIFGLLAAHSACLNEESKAKAIRVRKLSYSFAGPTEVY